jgi:hypothetical protein
MSPAVTRPYFFLAVFFAAFFAAFFAIRILPPLHMGFLGESHYRHIIGDCPSGHDA